MVPRSNRCSRVPGDCMGKIHFTTKCYTELAESLDLKTGRTPQMEAYWVAAINTWHLQPGEWEARETMLLIEINENDSGSDPRQILVPFLGWPHPAVMSLEADCFCKIRCALFLHLLWIFTESLPIVKTLVVWSMYSLFQTAKVPGDHICLGLERAAVCPCSHPILYLPWGSSGMSS